MRTCKILFFAVLSFFAMTMCSQAEVKDVSFRYGRGFDGKDFDQFDIAVSMALPWQRSLNSGWLTHFDVEGILGVLTLDGDTAVKPSVMSNVLVTSPAGKLDVIAGIGMGVMLGDTKFSDDHDLGGPFFFQGQVGVRWYFTENIFAGYRCYHQSNAHIYSSNNSVNLNQVEIGWTF